MRSICHELVEVKYKWDTICFQLGVPFYKLKEFEKEMNPLVATINYWLNGNVERVSVSWSSIVTALKSSSVNEISLANKIKKKHCLKDDEDDEGTINSIIYTCSKIIIIFLHSFLKFSILCESLPSESLPSESLPSESLPLEALANIIALPGRIMQYFMHFSLLS